jgi:hypothetical protein
MYVGPLFFAFTGAGISWSHVQEPRWGNATSQWVLWSMLLKYRCSDGSKSYVNYKMKIKENRAVTMHKARSHQQCMQQTKPFLASYKSIPAWFAPSKFLLLWKYLLVLHPVPLGGCSTAIDQLS